MSLLKFRFLLIPGFILLSLHGTLMAQEADTLFQNNGFSKPNGLYLEILGPGAVYSVGYERMLLNQDQFKTSIQAGLAWYPPSAGAVRMTMPVTINEILSFDRHHIKLGAGSTIILKHKQDADIGNTLDFLAHLRIAYRYQETAGKVFWEISLVPFLGGDMRVFELQALSSVTAHLWAGFSLGWAF